MNMNIGSLKQTLFENYEDGLIQDDDLEKKANVFSTVG